MNFEPDARRDRHATSTAVPLTLDQYTNVVIAQQGLKITDAQEIVACTHICETQRV